MCPNSIRSGPGQVQEEERGYSAEGFPALTLDPHQSRWWTCRIGIVPLRAVAASLREKVRDIPGAIITVYPGGLVSRVMTLGADEPIDVEIVGYDLATGSRLAKEVAEIVRGIRGATDIQVGREEGFPEYQVRVRQDRIASLGLTTSRVAEIVRGAIEGTESSIYVDPQTGREHNVRVRLREEDRRRPEDLMRLPVPALGGKVVPLENVAEIVRVSTPIQLERKYQQRIVHVTANTSGRDLGSIANEIETKISQMKIPEGFSVRRKERAWSRKRLFKCFCSLWHSPSS